ncbi:MAG: cytochrome ubiquinol oxidase subunit I [Acidimicrobiia bacterium]
MALSEFGLLGPELMRRGDALGNPFASEGLFFVEAIFIAIHIFGWARLRPWACTDEEAPAPT